MDEQKSMSRDEMVVGSCVCPVDGGGPRGVVTRVEFDGRGPEYDLLHVLDVDGSMLCQRVVMRLVDQPAISGQYEDSPQGLTKRIADLEAALKSASDARNMATTLLHKSKPEYDRLYAAHEKAHEDLAREIANHEAADKLARKLSDERHALRAQLIAREDDEAMRLKGLRQVARDRAYEIERQKHELAHVKSREREARDEAAAQRERADVWQAAAQDALDQMAHWRKQAKEKTKLCDMTVDVDFRHTSTLAALLAALAPTRDKKVQR